MAIFDSARQLLLTCTSIIHTRLELATVEIEEELERFSSILLRSLAVLFCICCAIILVVILLLAMFWDSHKIELICGLIAVFTTAAGLIRWSVKKQIREQPRLMSHTLSELKKDIAALKSRQSEPTKNQD